MTSRWSLWRKRKAWEARLDEYCQAKRQVCDPSTRLDSTCSDSLLVELLSESQFMPSVSPTSTEPKFTTDNCTDDLNDWHNDINDKCNDDISHTDDEFNRDEVKCTKLPIPATKIEISAALILFKARHKLSNSCIDDLCKLLKTLNVFETPISYSQVNRVLQDQCFSTDPSNKYTVCTKCDTVCRTSCKCENIECSEAEGYTQTPLQLLHMPIKPQVTEILARSPHLNIQLQSKQSRPIIKDIYDGIRYRSVCENEVGKFLSLTMNTDGIQVSKSSNLSLWVISFVINEIQRKERFKMNNAIIAGICSGSSKPSRNQMRNIFNLIVKELLVLQNGHYYEVASLDSSMIKLKLHLLVACCDKPAAAMIQNIGEPQGIFGCGRCHIEGITVPYSDDQGKRIRVFPITEGDKEEVLRTNETYDECVSFIEQEQQLVKSKMANKKPRNRKLSIIEKEAFKHLKAGHRGPCPLRQLRYFDVGESFASDSLRNLYHGVGRRLLKLWFSSEYRNYSFSCFHSIDIVDQYLSTIKYPSSTARLPRSIRLFHKYKANEVKIIILFGFVAFRSVMNRPYYQHFLLLVIGIHLAENRLVYRTQIDVMRKLFDKFLIEFPKLYSARHNVQVVHSLKHVAASVRDFGQLHNYSTFNFESLLDK